MADIPAISDAEWEVMNVVWDQTRVTAAEVVESLAGRFEWHPRTIKTMLNRLVKKGALLFEAQGKRYVYRAAAKREQCVRSESRSFVDRVFGGAMGAMLLHFVSQADLSPEQIKELRELLARKSK
ncbi:MAG: BlaI/MecI/CopY family transcriptional regulator [Planctomycetota bacterium]|nr:BlaI/MecI/CopY family transcriptional regulator [Planctomycetota bacterium]